MVTFDPEVLHDVACDLGEGPSYNAQRDEISWVDITAGRVFRSSGHGPPTVFDVDHHVGAALPADDGGFLLARRDGFVHLGSGGEQRELALPLVDRPSMRFNDGKTDPHGRAFAGTMAYDIGAEPAALYRLDGDDAAEVVSNVGLANGLGWSPDGSTMYFIDSVGSVLTKYGYDIDTGAVGDAATLIDFSSASGMPDGMCVDETGALWVALWDAGEVHRYTPAGELDARVELPVARPTSCCFARDRLIITTASYGLTADELNQQPHAGHVFACDVGVGGRPATLWRATT